MGQKERVSTESMVPPSTEAKTEDKTIGQPSCNSHARTHTHTHSTHIVRHQAKLELHILEE